MDRILWQQLVLFLNNVMDGWDRWNPSIDRCEPIAQLAPRKHGIRGTELTLFLHLALDSFISLVRNGTVPCRAVPCDTVHASTDKLCNGNGRDTIPTDGSNDFSLVLEKCDLLFRTRKQYHEPTNQQQPATTTNNQQPSSSSRHNNNNQAKQPWLFGSTWFDAQTTTNDDNNQLQLPDQITPPFMSAHATHAVANTMMITTATTSTPAAASATTDTTTITSSPATPTPRSPPLDPPPNLNQPQRRASLISSRLLLLWKNHSTWLCSHVILSLLFVGYLTVTAVSLIHDQYYVPLWSRVERTNDDLRHEFTYYRRDCTHADLSTHDVMDLIVSHDKDRHHHHNNSNSNTTRNRTIDKKQMQQQMMTHGAVVIPQVLSPTTLPSLRAWIVARNAAVTAAEQYPVSQGTNRLSYGIDPTEHPVVAQAVAELTHHPLLQALLTTLLGDDNPASAEITAITSYAGSPDQAWHADTKADGNAVQFARTYTHSYSFFVPLQNTTAAMGATDLCPGTHYCANPLATLCQQHPLGLYQATPAHVWPAGYGALVNQHLWHRGAAHTDPEAPERIVLILSFLARPRNVVPTSPHGPHDVRQLSRGTYFHQKWNMWGHTWRDLQEPWATMRWPWSVLRCLRLWKPASAQWGYDLVTSVLLRVANRQLDPTDLTERLVPRLQQWGMPRWLLGSTRQGSSYQEDTGETYVYDQKLQWSYFVAETIHNIQQLVQRINLVMHSLFAMVVVCAALRTGSRHQATFPFSTSSSSSSSRGWHLIRRALTRLVLTHGVAYLLLLTLLYRIRTSPWGRGILSGHTWMRPFPPVTIPRDEEAIFVTSGPTTWPTRLDVLMGSRYDAPFLGSYDHWLDYHPGNVLLQTVTQQCVPLVRPWRGSRHGPVVPSGLAQLCLEYVARVIRDHDGRFLQQDYRTGDWRELRTEQEMWDVIQWQMATLSSDALAAVRRQIDWALADYRFGILRQTALARQGQLRLWSLKQTVLTTWWPSSPATEPSLTTAGAVVSPATRPWRLFRNTLATPLQARMGREQRTPAHLRSACVFQPPDIRPGSLVWVFYSSDETWYPGTVLSADYDTEQFVVSFNDGSLESSVPLHLIQKRPPVVQGDRVVGCYQPLLQDCYPGTILRVMPSGDVSIAYDDGDVAWRVQPSHYYTPPFIHSGLGDDDVY